MIMDLIGPVLVNQKNLVKRMNITDDYGNELLVSSEFEIDPREIDRLYFIDRKEYFKMEYHLIARISRKYYVQLAAVATNDDSYICGYISVYNDPRKFIMEIDWSCGCDRNLMYQFIIDDLIGPAALAYQRKFKSEIFLGDKEMINNDDNAFDIKSCHINNLYYINGNGFRYDIIARCNDHYFVQVYAAEIGYNKGGVNIYISKNPNDFIRSIIWPRDCCRAKRARLYQRVIDDLMGHILNRQNVLTRIAPNYDINEGELQLFRIELCEIDRLYYINVDSGENYYLTIRINRNNNNDFIYVNLFVKYNKYTESPVDGFMYISKNSTPFVVGLPNIYREGTGDKITSKKRKCDFDDDDNDNNDNNIISKKRIRN